MISAREELLIDRWLKRETGSLQPLLDECGRPAYGFCVLCFSGNVQMASDVFLRAFSLLLVSEELKKFKTPIFPQLLSRLVHEIRQTMESVRQTLQVSELKEDDFKKIWPSAETAMRKRFQVLLKALASMPREEKLALLMRDQLDLGHTEMSRILGKSEKEIHQTLLRARILLEENVERSMGRDTK